jgi:hypothetical protein
VKKNVSAFYFIFARAQHPGFAVLIVITLFVTFLQQSQGAKKMPAKGAGKMT